MRSAQLTHDAGAMQHQYKDLCNDFYIMLQEAGSRCTSRDALCVISGVLNNLSQEHMELAPLVPLWQNLLKTEGIQGEEDSDRSDSEHTEGMEQDTETPRPAVHFHVAKPADENDGGTDESLPV